MDARRVLEPAAEGAGEALPDTEVHHQARQEAARCQSWAHRRSGQKKNDVAFTVTPRMWPNSAESRILAMLSLVFVQLNSGMGIEISRTSQNSECS